MLKTLCRQCRQACRTRAHRQQEFRNVGGLLQRPTAEVVFPAEGDDAALADKSVKFKVAKRQTRKAYRERGLFARGQEIFFVDEALHGRRRCEELELRGHRVSARAERIAKEPSARDRRAKA